DGVLDLGVHRGQGLVDRVSQDFGGARHGRNAATDEHAGAVEETPGDAIHDSSDDPNQLADEHVGSPFLPRLPLRAQDLRARAPCAPSSASRKPLEAEEEAQANTSSCDKTPSAGISKSPSRPHCRTVRLRQQLVSMPRSAAQPRMNVWASRSRYWLQGP